MSQSQVAERGAAYALQTAVAPAFGASFDLLATAPQGVANLRQLILSFAIRGKLVPQNAADGSASSLLKRVHEERMELAARGMLKRRTAELVNHDEEWAELPTGWAWTCLANIGVINPRNDVSDDTEASFVQMSSVPVALLAPHKSERRLWREIKSGFTHFAEGDVGIAKITPCFENGKSTVFRNLESGIGAGTTELHVVRPLASISPDYVLSFLKSPEFLLPGEKGMTGSAGQKRLSRHYFETRAFPLPPLAEQARIVARVEELMQLCDALEAHGRLQDEQHARLVAALFDALAASTSADELAENWQRIATHFDLLLDRPEAVDALEQTLLQLAVQGLLVPQDPADEPASQLLSRIFSEKEKLFRTGCIKRPKPVETVDEGQWSHLLPKQWMLTRFDDYVIELCTGPFGSMVHKEDYISGGVPLVNPSHMIRGRVVADSDVSVTIKKAAELRAYTLSEGDMLLARRGEVGRYAVIAREQHGWLCGTGSFFVRLSKDVCRPYLELIFSDPSFRSYLQGESIGTTMTNLNQRILLTSVLAIPPLAEQHRIVARVEQLRRLCTDLRERLQQARATQSRLADALVSAAAQSPSC